MMRPVTQDGERCNSYMAFLKGSGILLTLAILREAGA